jgi:hypothetical protein
MRPDPELMTTDNKTATAAQQYAKALVAHHTERDLLGALQSYRQVIDLHPGAPEAGYSRTQILGIANQVVPEAEILAAQAELAQQHLLLTKAVAATVMQA